MKHDVKDPLGDSNFRLCFSSTVLPNIHMGVFNKFVSWTSTFCSYDVTRERTLKRRHGTDFWTPSSGYNVIRLSDTDSLTVTAKVASRHLLDTAVTERTL